MEKLQAFHKFLSEEHNHVQVKFEAKYNGNTFRTTQNTFEKSPIPSSVLGSTESVDIDPFEEILPNVMDFDFEEIPFNILDFDVSNDINQIEVKPLSNEMNFKVPDEIDIHYSMNSMNSKQ